MLENNNYLENYTYEFVKLNNEDLQHCSDMSFYLFSSTFMNLDFFRFHASRLQMRCKCKEDWLVPFFTLFPFYDVLLSFDFTFVALFLFLLEDCDQCKSALFNLINFNV